MVGILKTDIEETAHIEASARVLDRFYIPARYPNGWAEGIPADYISEEDACNALSHSEKIIRFCDSLLA
jgi:HEPN domain-containing protein